MSATGAPRIPYSSLSMGPRLGDGGQGTVWTVHKRLINNTWPVVYKEYKQDALGKLKVDALERMVGFLPGMTAPEGRWLAEHTAWPAALVTEGAAVRGFLMRQIPDEYFITLRSSGEKKPAGLEFLLNPEAYLRKVVGVVPSPRQLFSLLLALADTLHRLHTLHVVAGDLSPKNLLFSLSGQPGCFLIDCDAMGVGGEWVLKPVQTPAWGLPAGEQPVTPQGDVYKFALLAVRLFLREQQGDDPTVLRSVNRAVAELAVRGLHRTPGNRPALAEWLEPLRQAVASAPNAWPSRTAQTVGNPSVGNPSVGNPSVGTQTVGTPAAPAQAAGGRSGNVGTGSPRPSASGPGRGRPASTTSYGTSYGTPYGGNAPSRGSSPPRRGTGQLVGLLLLAIVGWGGWTALHHADDGSAGSSSSAGSGSGGGSGSSGTDQVTQTPATRQAQAEGLNGLLVDNSGNRGSVAKAVQSVLSCPGSAALQDAREVFGSAADARSGLLDKLDTLAVDQLPDSMTSDLRTAWQSSRDADQAYVRLVDEVSGGCVRGQVTAADAWQDASRAGERATTAKKDFVAAWNPVAETYGMRSLAWTDL
ncbi:hypothetical protein OG762_26420 [Streptomyces sp. NBC_01136]|uniref:hypothetical protein n=1 Tax=unclassified Streptomyces TaxID=2593676 RepID=UPI00324BD34C|nr:hypothetical protein OG762_26420 [Streptomyces sp. NBC_01136]